MQWRGLLSERGWDDMFVGHKRPGLHGHGRRLPQLRHLDLLGVHRPGRLGIVLHERLHGRGDVSVEHEPSDVRRWVRWLHRRDHDNLLDRGSVRALRNSLVRRSKLGRMADAEQSSRRDRGRAES
jgi:hypothetical protein